MQDNQPPATPDLRAIFSTIPDWRSNRNGDRGLAAPDAPLHPPRYEFELGVAVGVLLALYGLPV